MDPSTRRCWHQAAASILSLVLVVACSKQAMAPDKVLDGTAAVYLALGQQRADGTTYEQFAQRRYVRLCPEYAAKDFDFQFFEQRPPEGTFWQIVAHRASHDRPKDCSLPRTFDIALVSKRDGAVTEFPQHRDDINFTDWLTDFRDGDSP